VRYVVRRLGFFALTLWVALTLNFFIPRFMPGNPLDALRARTHDRLSPAALEQMLTSYGFKPHQNIFVQYLEYLRNMFTGHWGISIGATLGEPVSTIVWQALPWTLGLVGVTTVLAFLLGWLPSDFNYDPDLLPEFSLGFIENVLKHAVLPAATILIASIGAWILTMRNNMITTLAEDYVRMGRAKGLSNSRIMTDYAARNAMLPNLSGFAMSLGFVITGSILVEYVFNYPGLGYQLYNAVQNTDYPLMQALFMLFTVAVLVALLVCDFAIAWLDPRVRATGSR